MRLRNNVPTARFRQKVNKRFRMLKNGFSTFASAVNRFVSSPAATGAAFLVIIVWALFGPPTHYSNSWQLLINTGTTIVTFLMVFVLNNAQSRDTTAMNAKLDALISAIEKADNRLIGLESKPASQVDELTAEIRESIDKPNSAAVE